MGPQPLAWHALSGGGRRSDTTVSDDIHRILSVLNQPLIFTAACLAVVIVCAAQPLFPSSTSTKVARHGDDEEYKYKITKCPNPNCARCSRYAELNRSAQRRLPYVAKGKTLQRIRHAITAGPDVIDDEQEAQSVEHVHVSPVSGQRPNVLLVRGLLARPFVTKLHQDACIKLENVGRNVILSEYVQAMQSPSASTLENDVTRGTWQVLHLMKQGEWVKSNVALCPKTRNALRSLGKGRTMEGCIFGNVFISVLHPGTVIDPHCGPTNIRHRLHYPLQVPDTKEGVEVPKLRVAEQKATWKEGECFVFDDSIVHSVSFGEEGIVSSSSAHSNENAAGACGGCRVVLIVDLWHPDLTREERHAIADLYPSVGK